MTATPSFIQIFETNKQPETATLCEEMERAQGGLWHDAHFVPLKFVRPTGIREITLTRRCGFRRVALKNDAGHEATLREGCVGWMPAFWIREEDAQRLLSE